MTRYRVPCACGGVKESRSAECRACLRRRQVENYVTPAVADYARRRFAEGYGPRVIAFEVIRDGLVADVSIEGLVQRLVRWRRTAGIPLLRIRRAVRGQPAVDPAAILAQRLATSARLQAEREAREAEALRLVRPQPRCGFCDTARPGRRCVECGAVAPGRRA